MLNPSHSNNKYYCLQFSSVAQLCPVCNPMDCSMPGFSVHHQFLELAQTHVHQVGDAIQSSHPLSSPSLAVLVDTKFLVAQSYLTLCNPLDCSPPGSSVPGIFQARILERVSFLLLGIFLTQGSKPCLLHLFHCKWILYLLSYRKKQWIQRLN